MRPISPLIASLVMSGLARATVRKQDLGINATGVGLVFLAGLVGLVGFVFLVIAAYRVLLRAYEPVAAAGLTGGSVVLLAIILAFGGVRLIKLHRRPIAQIQETTDEKLHRLLNDFPVTEFENLVKENPKTSVVVAGIAGLLAADALRPH